MKITDHLAVTDIFNERLKALTGSPALAAIARLERSPSLVAVATLQSSPLLSAVRAAQTSPFAAFTACAQGHAARARLTTSPTLAGVNAVKASERALAGVGAAASVTSEMARLQDRLPAIPGLTAVAQF